MIQCSSSQSRARDGIRNTVHPNRTMTTLHNRRSQEGVAPVVDESRKEPRYSVGIR
jgi:hypothetical protein